MYRFYSNPTEGSVRVSVVGEYDKGKLKLAVSRCSRKDQFMRKKGRSIAEGRFAKGKYFKVLRLDYCDIHTFVEAAKIVAKEVIDSKRVVSQREGLLKRLLKTIRHE